MNKKELSDRIEKDIIETERMEIKILIKELRTMKPTDEDFPKYINRCYNVLQNYQGDDFEYLINELLTVNRNLEKKVKKCRWKTIVENNGSTMKNPNKYLIFCRDKCDGFKINCENYIPYEDKK